MGAFPEAIFRAYDIRGTADDGLTPDIAELIGRALAAEPALTAAGRVVVGRDGRLSSPSLAQGLVAGFAAAGVDVIDIGLVPTPALYYAALTHAAGNGVMVTGSHNPKEYNGAKMMVGGETLAGDRITAVRDRAAAGGAASAAKPGGVEQTDVSEGYLAAATESVGRLPRPYRVVVDAGNGAAGRLGPMLLERIGCEVVPLYCEIDGSFPNHHPDPARPENLHDAERALEESGAELAVVFDGDGDRLGVVAPGDGMIFPDKVLMVFARSVLADSPGAKVIYDVKCTSHLEPWIRSCGGEPVMCRTGHSYVKAEIRRTQAVLAGEMSGHFFFADRWPGFDDGIYAAARLIAIAAASESPADLFAGLPGTLSSPELNILAPGGDPHGFMDRLVASAKFPGADRVVTIDGLRVEYAGGFGLVRASNTTPSLVLRFEATDSAGLELIQSEFRTCLQTVEPNLKLPF